MRKEFRSDLPWRWQAFAGRWLLVTDGGGEQVILSPERHSKIQTRDLETGTLRALAPSDVVSKIIATAPDIRRHAQALIHGIDIGEVHFDGPNRELEEIIRQIRVALTNSGAM
jgi:hypothetical protein